MFGVRCSVAMFGGERWVEGLMFVFCVVMFCSAHNAVLFVNCVNALFCVLLGNGTFVFECLRARLNAFEAL